LQILSSKCKKELAASGESKPTIIHDGVLALILQFLIAMFYRISIALIYPDHWYSKSGFTIFPALITFLALPLKQSTVWQFLRFIIDNLPFFLIWFVFPETRGRTFVEIATILGLGVLRCKNKYQSFYGKVKGGYLWYVRHFMGSYDWMLHLGVVY
jgi:hypothetical protein